MERHKEGVFFIRCRRTYVFKNITVAVIYHPFLISLSIVSGGTRIYFPPMFNPEFMSLAGHASVYYASYEYSSKM